MIPGFRKSFAALLMEQSIKRSWLLAKSDRNNNGK